MQVSGTAAAQPHMPTTMHWHHSKCIGTWEWDCHCGAKQQQVLSSAPGSSMSISEVVLDLA